MVLRGLFSPVERAMEDEPTFELLARDPSFGRMVRAWADERERAVDCGDRPKEDLEQVREARDIASEGEYWRRENLYKWRRQQIPITEGGEADGLTRASENPPRPET